MKPEVSVLSDMACHLGEGPSYAPGRDALFWFDIVERKMLEYRFSEGRTTIHDLPFMASAIAEVDGDRQLIVADDGLHLRDGTTGRIDPYRSVEADNHVTRSNDSRVHPSGALWFGTMGRNAEHKAGAIYWHLAGEVRRLYADVSIPNSICFTAAGDVAYFADTGRNILFRVDCDPRTGLPVGEPSTFLDHRGRPGGLDGSIMDLDGLIWNARWGSGTLDAYAADGSLAHSVPIPARQPSCPAFVGADASRIAVTSAWQGLDRKARAADPQGGMTFLVDVPVRGRHEPRARI